MSRDVDKCEKCDFTNENTDCHAMSLVSRDKTRSSHNENSEQKDGTKTESEIENQDRATIRLDRVTSRDRIGDASKHDWLYISTKLDLLSLPAESLPTVIVAGATYYRITPEVMIFVEWSLNEWDAKFRADPFSPTNLESRSAAIAVVQSLNEFTASRFSLDDFSKLAKLRNSGRAPALPPPPPRL
jgi:hypothetical protein